MSIAAFTSELSDRYHPYRTKRRFTRIRQAISRGEQLLDDVDQRCVEMRRLRDICEDLWVDLGGPDLSAQELILLRRAGMLTLQCEIFEKVWAYRSVNDIASGPMPPGTLGSYVMMTNSLRRVLHALGLKKRAKVIEGGMSSERAQEYLQERGIDAARVFDSPAGREEIQRPITPQNEPEAQRPKGAAQLQMPTAPSSASGRPGSFTQGRSQ